MVKQEFLNYFRILQIIDLIDIIEYKIDTFKAVIG